MSDYKWYGHFADNGYKYVITEPETPRHWYNYMYNDDYITFTSQVGFGEGFAQDDMGRRVPLIMNRNIFICEDKAWSILGLPMGYGYTDYSCTHKAGSTVISLTYNGIRSTLRVFVPDNGRQEIWSVSLKNLSGKERNVKLIPYAKTNIDAAYKPQGYNIAEGHFNKDKNAVYGYFYQEFFTKRNRPMWGYMSSGEDVTGFDARHTAFIGAYGDDLHPVAITKYMSCTNSDCIAEKICLALENTVSLKADEEKTIHYMVGVALNEDEISRPDNDTVTACFDAMEAKYLDRIRRVQIDSPWKDLNNLINGWLVYATDMGSRWARVRHNGFRDMTSDTGCLSVINAPLAWERIKRILTYQYDNGYAPRTIIDGELKDRKFADNTVWLTMAVYNIITETGDPDLLYEEVKFNNGTFASVYEHIRRSVEFLWNFKGLYGLIKIWGGDWNDCINYAGLEGKGVSVWLSIAWCYAAKQFAELAGYLGKKEDASLYMDRYREMRDTIDMYGWDGEYYLYARTDDDILMGSHTSEEGQIFLNPQIWAVFAGLDMDDRHIKGMDKAEELLETDLGILLSKPPYTHQYSYIGSMAEKPGGVQDNGGVYLHTAAWKLAADSMLKRNAKVEEGLKKILPFDNDYYETKGEPYCMFNCYYLPGHGYRKGTPGQSWRTGSNAWLVKSVVMYIFGLYAKLEGLKLEPCLPPSWRECSIKKLFRGCAYNITYIQTEDGPCNTVGEIKVNGKAVRCADNIIRPEKGKTLDIIVKLKN